MHDLSRTIAAVATPPGRGGIGCVRLSGPTAHAVARSLFRGTGAGEPAPGTPPRFGRFAGADGRAVDHGYLVLFDAAHAFTGEPAAELWSHGSPPVLAALLDAALAAGADAAEPGEFTYRALRSGRIDLTRAEAIRDLVAARTLHQARQAFAQAEGTLARRLAPLREALTDALARGEAAVEFADEAETHLEAGGLARLLDGAAAVAAELLAGHRRARVVREGASAVILGAPNVGKSSLFNRLLERERAIVSPHPGTTRDTLEEAVDLDGIPLRLTDTAGLRESRDPVEDEGVRRARAAREEADLLVWVLDASRETTAEELRDLAAAEAAAGAGRVVVAASKSDLPPAPAPLPRAEAIRVSARTGDGIEALRALLRERLAGAGTVENAVVADARHAAALARCHDAIDRARAAAAAGIPEEMVLEDVREAARHLGEITGEIAGEAIYERIFATFCIGK